MMNQCPHLGLAVMQTIIHLRIKHELLWNSEIINSDWTKP